MMTFTKYTLLNTIDLPAYTKDYNTPDIQPKPVEPTQSVVELPKPVQAAPATMPPSPPPLEVIKEEAELDSEQKQVESEEDGIDMIPMTENLAAEINKNKQCINDCPGIEISECDNSIVITNPISDDMEHSHIIPKEMLIPKPLSSAKKPTVI